MDLTQRNGPSAGASWGRNLQKEVPAEGDRHYSDVGSQSADPIKFYFRIQEWPLSPNASGPFLTAAFLAWRRIDFEARPHRLHYYGIARHAGHLVSVCFVSVSFTSTSR